jgi:hypothetical protein
LATKRKECPLVERNAIEERIISQLTKPIPNLQLNLNQLCLIEKNSQLSGSLQGYEEEPSGHILMYLPQGGTYGNHKSTNFMVKNI